MIDWMMSPMLSREGRVSCQNEGHRRRMSNLELEILEYSTEIHPSKTALAVRCEFYLKSSVLLACIQRISKSSLDMSYYASVVKHRLIPVRIFRSEISCNLPAPLPLPLPLPPPLPFPLPSPSPSLYLLCWPIYSSS